MQTTVAIEMCYISEKLCGSRADLALLYASCSPDSVVASPPSFVHPYCYIFPYFLAAYPYWMNHLKVTI